LVDYLVDLKAASMELMRYEKKVWMMVETMEVSLVEKKE